MNSTTMATATTMTIPRVGRRTQRRRVLTPLARRFYTVKEAAELMNLAPQTAEHDIMTGALPVVALPSTVPDAMRRKRAIPAAWLAGARWLDMDPALGLILTSPSAISAPGDPYAVTVDVAARACSMSGTHAYDLIRQGKFAVVKEGPRGRMMIAVSDLDAWALGLIHRAEREWFTGGGS